MSGTISNNRCLNCRFWQPPPPTARKPVGHCGIDGKLSHAGYGCKAFAHRPGVLARVLGLTQGEIDWLREHPDDRVTRLMRDEFAYAEMTGEHDVFQQTLKRWRAWRRLKKKGSAGFGGGVKRVNPSV